MRCRVKQRAIALDLRVLCDSAGGGGVNMRDLRAKGTWKMELPCVIAAR